MLPGGADHVPGHALLYRLSGHIAALALAGMLAACSPQAQDEIARSAARSALTPVVADTFPGVPLEPTLDCLIDNANAQQIRALAADAVIGPTESTVQIAQDIASKPETLRCLAVNGLPALLR
ncbi:hypothetical protein OA50_00277 [Mameliella alba]|uniref:Uncharacterized protein n=1 Tax=Mameliella alba TaxID=561184 RepID=A0A0B3SEV8_9RHOB|nr:hypothetical protein OA50_00277 [Mameliella alba]